MNSNNEHKSCPSSVCAEDAILLGKVKQDGTVSYFSNRMQLDESSVKEFQKLVEPERYYRFSSPCVQNGCKQWQGGGCSVIKKVLHAGLEDLPTDAPACIIRTTCRWFHQEGVQACYVCPMVITDSTIKED
jgi:hypothetical protein